MSKGELEGTEGQSGPFGSGIVFPVAVEGEADVCHLDADLVMAAGEKMNPDEGEGEGGESRIFLWFLWEPFWKCWCGRPLRDNL